VAKADGGEGVRGRRGVCVGVGEGVSQRRERSAREKQAAAEVSRIYKYNGRSLISSQVARGGRLGVYLK